MQTGLVFWVLFGSFVLALFKLKEKKRRKKKKRKKENEKVICISFSVESEVLE